MLTAFRNNGYLSFDYIKGTVSLGNKLFLNSTQINFGSNNTTKFSNRRNHVSKIHIRRHFPRIDMGGAL